MDQILFRNVTAVDINDLLKKHGSKKVFLVTGKESYKSTGAIDLIESLKSLNKREIIQFSNFSANPKIEDVLVGVNEFNLNGCDFIICIGGGSVIDMAKLINASQANSDDQFLSVVKNNLIKNSGVPLLAIPTTAGSGSEATHFAVVYINKKKYSLAHEFVLPNYIGFNYVFLKSQNVYQRACSGLDAISQAIEAFWSVNSTEESDSYAEQSLKFMLKNLRDIKELNNIERDNELFEGAYLAGKAINITKTTGPHALSYVLTTTFNIPHGHAVFMTLPNFLTFNYEVTDSDINDPRGIIFLKNKLLKLSKIFGHNDVYQTRQYLMNLAESLGIELSVSKLGISKDDIEGCLDVNFERMKNNPRKIKQNALLDLFNE